MDIIAGLTAAGQAVQIVKDLRDIERDLDSATYKAQMAELYSNLADVKIALSDAKEQMQNKDQQIRALQAQIATMQAGELCPICQTGRMKVTASKPHPTFGVMGVLERTLSCQNEACGHSDKVMHDPNGRS